MFEQNQLLDTSSSEFKALEEAVNSMLAGTYTSQNKTQTVVFVVRNPYTRQFFIGVTVKEHQEILRLKADLKRGARVSCKELQAAYSADSRFEVFCVDVPSKAVGMQLRTHFLQKYKDDPRVVNKKGAKTISEEEFANRSKAMKQHWQRPEYVAKFKESVRLRNSNPISDAKRANIQMYKDDRAEFGRGYMGPVWIEGLIYRSISDAAKLLGLPRKKVFTNVYSLSTMEWRYATTEDLEELIAKTKKIKEEQSKEQQAVEETCSA